MFSLNFKDIATKQFPSFLRNAKNLDFVTCWLKPLKYINEQLLLFREDRNYYLTFNGQIIYLEHFLNDQYDPVYRRIYIEDVANLEPIYIFDSAELRDNIYLFDSSEVGYEQVYLINKSEYLLEFEYIVKLPNDITYNEIEVRSKIDLYNIAGKRYIIETI